MIQHSDFGTVARSELMAKGGGKRRHAFRHALRHGLRDVPPNGLRCEFRVVPSNELRCGLRVVPLYAVNSFFYPDETRGFMAYRNAIHENHRNAHGQNSFLDEEKRGKRNKMGMWVFGKGLTA
jgi:hypothetical protein